MSRTKDFLISISEKYGFGGHVTEEVLEIARGEWENQSSVGKDQALLKDGFFDRLFEATKGDAEKIKATNYLATVLANEDLGEDAKNEINS